MSLSRSALSSISKSSALHRAILLPAAARPISTKVYSAEDSQEYLNKQRNLRPNSPWHIYQPQLTSVSSIANRATGVGLSVGLYALFLGHLALPAVGVPFDSTTLISAFADLPEWAKMSAKSLIAFPAAYHTLNGMRHLSWDSGKLLELKTSYAAGYAVLGATAVSGLALTLM